MRTMIALLIVALAMIPALCNAEEYDEPDPNTMTKVWALCKPDSYVCIRSKPNVHSSVEGRILFGDWMKTDGTRVGKWLKVYGGFEAGVGWASTEYLSDFEPVIYEKGAVMLTNAKQVICRTGRGGAILRKVKKNTAVKVWAMSEDWSVTDMGFISSRYLDAEVH